MLTVFIYILLKKLNSSFKTAIQAVPQLVLTRQVLLKISSFTLNISSEWNEERWKVSKVDAFPCVDLIVEQKDSQKIWCEKRKCRKKKHEKHKICFSSSRTFRETARLATRLGNSKLKYFFYSTRSRVEQFENHAYENHTSKNEAEHKKLELTFSRFIEPQSWAKYAWIVST